MGLFLLMFFYRLIARLFWFKCWYLMIFMIVIGFIFIAESLSSILELWWLEACIRLGLCEKELFCFGLHEAMKLDILCCLCTSFTMVEFRSNGMTFIGIVLLGQVLLGCMLLVLIGYLGFRWLLCYTHLF